MQYTTEKLIEVYNEAMAADENYYARYEDVENKLLEDWIKANYPGTGPGYLFKFPNGATIECYLHKDGSEEDIVDAEIIEDTEELEEIPDETLAKQVDAEESTDETIPVTEEPVVSEEEADE